MKIGFETRFWKKVLLPASPSTPFLKKIRKGRSGSAGRKRIHFKLPKKFPTPKSQKSWNSVTVCRNSRMRAMLYGRNSLDSLSYIGWRSLLISAITHWDHSGHHLAEFAENNIWLELFYRHILSFFL